MQERTMTHAHRTSRPRRKLILVPLAVVVVVAGILIGLEVTSGTGSTGCWTQSADGSVIAEEDVGQACQDTARLILSAQDGGAYTNLSGPVTHGPLVCTATPNAGPNTWKVWLAVDDPETSEARALCQFMGDKPAVSVTWAPGQKPEKPAVPGYTFAEGSDAASRVSEARINSYDIAYPDGGVSNAATWCSGNDPSSAAADNNEGQSTVYPSASGSDDYPGTPWYNGCMAELQNRGI
jgi:hypothetical protein